MGGREFRHFSVRTGHRARNLLPPGVSRFVLAGWIMVALLVFQSATEIIAIVGFLTPGTSSAGSIVSSSPILQWEDLFLFSILVVAPVLWWLTYLVARRARVAMIPESGRFVGVLAGTMTFNFLSEILFFLWIGGIIFLFGMEASYLGAMLFLASTLVRVGRNRSLYASVLVSS